MKTYMIGSLILCSIFSVFGCSDGNFDIPEISTNDTKNQKDEVDVETSNEAANLLLETGDSGSDSFLSDKVDSKEIPQDTKLDDSGIFVDTNPPTSDVSNEVIHTNGLGQTWSDDVPLKTYNRSQAVSAGNVWPYKDMTVKDTTCSADAMTAKCITFQQPTRCATWCYTGSIAGRVVLNESATNALCLCPISAGTEWK